VSEGGEGLEFDEQPVEIVPASMEKSAVKERSPLTIFDDAIARFNREGLRGVAGYEFLESVGSVREALNRMPQRKRGIVLGSGQNSEDWRRRGWNALDINPTAGADFTVDVNNMSEVVPAGSQDFLYAEHLRFHPGGNERAGWGRLPQQANLALKEGGLLTVRTANIEGESDATVPPREYFTNTLAEHGFDVVVGSISTSLMDLGLKVRLLNKWYIMRGKLAKVLISPNRWKHRPALLELGGNNLTSLFIVDMPEANRYNWLHDWK